MSPKVVWHIHEMTFSLMVVANYKGWNGLQHSFSSGIEIFTALSHDFVLHHNF